MEASPSNVTFSGVEIGATARRTVRVINRKRSGIRLKASLREDSCFTVEVPPSGLLATGMHQLITVIFTPKEYTVYSDVIHVESENDSLLISVFAFPLKNTITIPHEISLGHVPLCETITKVVYLKSTLPIDFNYRAEFQQPHPYFKLEAASGHVAANATGAITVVFRAISLVTCVVLLRVLIDSADEQAMEPLECTLTARSVSGLLEAKSTRQLKMKLTQTLAEKQETLQSDTLQMTLRSFHAKSSDAALLSASSSVSRPLGIGSGAAFDAGGDWIATLHRQHYKPRPVQEVPQETTVHGVVVPAQLSSVTAVNYVLTQDRATLKPRELRKMMEQTRRERALNEKLVAKTAEDSSAACTFALKLSDILAQERLNMRSEADPRLRLQRELAFLTVAKEAEARDVASSFRVSEEFSGGPQLAREEEVRVVQMREEIAAFNARDEWRAQHARAHTERVSVEDGGKRVGVSRAALSRLLSACRPVFDVNTVDGWAKRVGTVKTFVRMVSRCILRNRVARRLALLQSVLAAAQVKTRKECQAFVEAETAMYKSKGGDFSATSPAKPSRGMSTTAAAEVPRRAASSSAAAMSELVMDMPNEYTVMLERNQALLSQVRLVPTDRMTALQTMPRFIPEDSALAKSAVVASDTHTEQFFEDRKLGVTKKLLEYETMGYSAVQPPPLSLHYNPDPDRPLRQGASEDCSRREHSEDVELPPAPAWLMQAPVWTVSERNHAKPHHNSRTYVTGPLVTELDYDKALHFDANSIQYPAEPSLRNKFKSAPGFASAQLHLLQDFETRNKVDITSFHLDNAPSFQKGDPKLMSLIAAEAKDATATAPLEDKGAAKHKAPAKGDKAAELEKAKSVALVVPEETREAGGGDFARRFQVLQDMKHRNQLERRNVFSEKVLGVLAHASSNTK